jgi:hypothetical protein
MPPRFNPTVLALALFAAATTIPSCAQTDISIPPIPNVPFSAVVHIERSTIRPDGSVASFKTTRDIHRDGTGRTYEAVRPPLPVSHTEDSAVARILLYDPQTSIATSLDAKTHTFVQEIIDHPPSTAPPSMGSALSADNTGLSKDYIKEEDLGTREISGISTHGVRRLQITPADASGTGKQIVITDEYWFSDDLRIFLTIKHDDPRRGAVTLTVGEITRAEPDPALFKIPGDYKPKY